MSTFTNNDLYALYEEHKKKQNIINPVIVDAIVKNFENMVMLMNLNGDTKISWLVTQTNSLDNIEEAVCKLQQIFMESKITIHKNEKITVHKNEKSYYIEIDWSLEPDSDVSIT